jgi:phage RecT family recombinase
MGTDLITIDDLPKVLNDKKLIARFNGNRFDKEGMRWAAEREYAIQVFKANPSLLKCDPDTIRTSLLEVAWSGMSLAPALAHAYLIPYDDRERGVRECTFKPGYRGLAYMAQKGGAVKGFTLGRVLEQDFHHPGKFRVYTQNNRKVVEHEENWQVQNRGKLVACYAISLLASGESHVEVTSAEIIEAAFKASMTKNPKGGFAWKGPFRDQMELKVSIRRNLKLVPADATGWLQRGIEVVDKHDGIDFGKLDADAGEPAEVCLSEQQITELHAVLTDNGYTSERATKTLHNLAEFYGARALEFVPAAKFEDAKARLLERAKQAAKR